MIEVISLGGGVQSSTMVLMSLLGEIKPGARCAIFADTNYERWQTYEYIDWLEKLCGSDLPIHRVSAGNIRDDMLETERVSSHIPTFTLPAKRGTRKHAMLNRQCTREYKIDPIKRKLRELYGFQQFSQWIGITIDESYRLSDSRVKYIKHRYPLALEKRMRRGDCIGWLEKRGFPVRLGARASVARIGLIRNGER